MSRHENQKSESSLSIFQRLTPKGKANARKYYADFRVKMEQLERLQREYMSPSGIGESVRIHAAYTNSSPYAAMNHALMYGVSQQETKRKAWARNNARRKAKRQQQEAVQNG